MLLNNGWITEEVKEEIKKQLETNENKNTIVWIYGTQQKQCKKEVYNDTSLPQEIREIWNKQPKFIAKETGKSRTNNTQN